MQFLQYTDDLLKAIRSEYVNNIVMNEIGAQAENICVIENSLCKSAIE